MLSIFLVGAWLLLVRWIAPVGVPEAGRTLKDRPILQLTYLLPCPELENRGERQKSEGRLLHTSTYVLRKRTCYRVGTRLLRTFRRCSALLSTRSAILDHHHHHHHHYPPTLSRFRVGFSLRFCQLNITSNQCPTGMISTCGGRIFEREYLGFSVALPIRFSPSRAKLVHASTLQ